MYETGFGLKRWVFCLCTILGSNCCCLAVSDRTVELYLFKLESVSSRELQPSKLQQDVGEELVSVCLHLG